MQVKRVREYRGNTKGNQRDNCREELPSSVWGNKQTKQSKATGYKDPGTQRQSLEMDARPFVGDPSASAVLLGSP